MSKKQLPPIEILHKLLRYEPTMGLLYWKEREPDMFNIGSNGGKLSAAKVWNKRYYGAEAFISLNGAGYKIGSIYNKSYRAQRVIWAMCNGEWPTFYIDHINHIRTDNRLENLRDVPPSVNNKNCTINKRNKSGFNGVRWDKRTSKWRAQIGFGGVTLLIGSFSNIESAIDARKKASKTYGYHKNHGRTL